MYLINKSRQRDLDSRVVELASFSGILVNLHYMNL